MNNQTFQKLSPDATIGEIITANEKAGQLLASIGLSAENHRDESLRSVCQQRQWSEVEVLKWLQKNEQIPGKVNGEDAGKVIDGIGDSFEKYCAYIEEHHIEKTAGLLEDIFDKFPRVHQIHSTQYPWLNDIKWYMESLQEKLNYYIKFEKEKFFPLLKEIDDAGSELLDGTISNIRNGLAIIREDQKEILDLIRDIRRKGNSLESPEGSCFTLQIFNRDLKALFDSVEEQIEMERNDMLPLVGKKLKSE